MGFLLKVAVFVSLVILLIPADEAEVKKLANGRAISAVETYGLVSSVYEDAQGFCGRNKDACEIGQVAAATFGAKARTGARWLYGYFDPNGGRVMQQMQQPAPGSSQPMPPPINQPAVQSPKSEAPVGVTSTTGSIRDKRTVTGPAQANPAHHTPSASSLPDIPMKRPS